MKNLLLIIHKALTYLYYASIQNFRIDDLWETNLLLYNVCAYLLLSLVFWYPDRTLFSKVTLVILFFSTSFNIVYHSYFAHVASDVTFNYINFFSHVAWFFIATEYALSVSLVAQSCLNLCNPMDCSRPGLLVHCQLLEFTQTRIHWLNDDIQPSHPLSSPSPPTFNLSQHQGLFK